MTKLQLKILNLWVSVTIFVQQPLYAGHPLNALPAGEKEYIYPTTNIFG